jgi:hypothetical protein
LGVRSAPSNVRFWHLADIDFATADREAVTAAVRGTSGEPAPEPPPNFNTMSDAELQSYTREEFGFDSLK